MKEAMRKGLISLITGSALAASPMAFAAQDTNGMQYTSAAEGFYGSIRLVLDSGETDNDGAEIQNSVSRVGVRGTNDLGGGLTGYYQWELGIDTNQGGKDDATRLAVVGLRGGFGDIGIGSQWANTYNWVYSSTDVTNDISGNHARQFRLSKSVQYTTPDLNGFQAAIQAQMDNELSVDDVTITRSEPTTAQGGTGNDDPDLFGATIADPEKDKDDLDNWALVAKYSVQGFDVAAAYVVDVKGAYKGTPAAVDHGGTETTKKATRKDLTSYALRAGYSQDNWYVNTWYEVYDDKDTWVYDEDDIEEDAGTIAQGSDISTSTKDTEILSFAAGVSVDKVNVYGFYESKDYYINAAEGEGEDNYGGVGVQYNLGANSRIWVEYQNVDADSDEDLEDKVVFGLRHDF